MSIANPKRYLELLLSRETELDAGTFDRHREHLFNQYNEIPFDPEKIKQVIINLIKNAIEAISEEGKLIIQTDQDRDFVKIHITDTGIGIPAESINEIFNPFFSTKKKGTGLGLAISYKIIKDHKGEIKISSELGKGSSFVIYLPVSR